MSTSARARCRSGERKWRAPSLQVRATSSNARASCARSARRNRAFVAHDPAEYSAATRSKLSAAAAPSPRSRCAMPRSRSHRSASSGCSSRSCARRSSARSHSPASIAVRTASGGDASQRRLPASVAGASWRAASPRCTRRSSPTQSTESSGWTTARKRAGRRMAIGLENEARNRCHAARAASTTHGVRDPARTTESNSVGPNKLENNTRARRRFGPPGDGTPLVAIPGTPPARPSSPPDPASPPSRAPSASRASDCRRRPGAGRRSRPSGGRSSSRRRGRCG